MTEQTPVRDEPAGTILYEEYFQLCAALGLERERNAALEAQLAGLAAAAHMPPDYPHGLLSWINQRLYRTYIEQGESQAQWDALTAALDARDKAEAQLAESRAQCDVMFENMKQQAELVATMRATLGVVEWEIHTDGHLHCVYCGNRRDYGHRPGCCMDVPNPRDGEE